MFGVILLPFRLYLIEILHQTTTLTSQALCLLGCILSKFYIKPQLRLERELAYCVVSYRNSTSNHNSSFKVSLSLKLYLIEILHQTTTCSAPMPFTMSCILSKFYIKPQLNAVRMPKPNSCILSKFYIKPQLLVPDTVFVEVVSYRNSTSNHNLGYRSEFLRLVVSYRNSTSNHNCAPTLADDVVVVSYRNSTSNHNYRSQMHAQRVVVSYRNSTSNHNLMHDCPGWSQVVSYRNSTSNHNYRGFAPILLYVVSYRNSTSNHNTSGSKKRRCAVVSYRNSTSNHNL